MTIYILKKLFVHVLQWDINTKQRIIENYLINNIIIQIYNILLSLTEQ